MIRKRAGGEIQRLDGDEPLQVPRNELVVPGVLARDLLETQRRNGELDARRQDRALLEQPLPEPPRKAV